MTGDGKRFRVAGKVVGDLSAVVFERMTQIERTAIARLRCGDSLSVILKSPDGWGRRAEVVRLVGRSGDG